MMDKKDWISLPLKKMIDLKSGVTIAKELERQSGEIPFVRVSDFNLKGNEKYISTSATYADVYSEKQLIPINSIVFPKRGGAIATNKKRITAKPMLIDLNTMAAICKPELDAELFYYWFLKIDLGELDGASSSVPQINNEDIYGLQISIPKNKSDQQRIVNEIKSKLEKVEQMRQAALQQKEAVEALQGALLRELFPYKEGDELPKGWKWEKLDDVAKVNKLRKKKSAATPKEPTSFVPMECVDDITGKITKTFLRPYDELGQSYTYFENGDVIFAKITPCMQNGKCAIVSEMKDGFGYGSSEYIVFTPSKPIYTKWVHYFLRTVELRKNAEDHFTGSAGQQRVPVDYLQKYKIPVPEDETLIEKLTDALDKKHEEYFNLITQTEAQLEAIEAMPAAILREVFDFNNPVNKKSGEA